MWGEGRSTPLALCTLLLAGFFFTLVYMVPYFDSLVRR
jgi:hypothetical protein